MEHCTLQLLLADARNILRGTVPVCIYQLVKSLQTANSDIQLSFIFILEQLENSIHPIIQFSIMTWKHMTSCDNRLSSTKEVHGHHNSMYTQQQLSKLG
jgi:hypothetical protein